MIPSPQWLVVLGGLAIAACSAPALQVDLESAQRHERAGAFDAALADYREAQARCREVRSRRHRRETCTGAYLQYAELLDRLDRKAEAAQAYDEASRVLTTDEGRASALYHAGRVELGRGNEVPAYQRLWKTVTDFPDTAHAADALELVVRDGRTRDPGELYRVLTTLSEPLVATEVGDNLEFWLATLAEEHAGDPARALLHWDRIWEHHPRSGLRDESRWHGARLARQLGDPRGAARRLEQLLATREVAVGAGSYFSIWLDDAQLELGRVRRDALGDPGGAIAAFTRLAKDYPASILRDDALHELIVTHASVGDTARACATRAKLAATYPDSKFLLAEAGPSIDELRCPRPTR